jgi:hypothetical protein
MPPRRRIDGKSNRLYLLRTGNLLGSWCGEAPDSGEEIRSTKPEIRNKSETRSTNETAKKKQDDDMKSATANTRRPHPLHPLFFFLFFFCCFFHYPFIP